MLFPVLLLAFVADIRGCVCDPARPDTMQARECGLTHAALSDTDAAPVFFVKDANPTKPNRWLAIPHALRHTLNDMTPEERTAYWSAAIEKARSLWPDQWAVAVNAEDRRSQCQLHAHIGKVLDTTDRTGGILVDTVDDIPLPPPGSGIWIHAEGSKLRVHPGQSAPETGLMR